MVDKKKAPSDNPLVKPILLDKSLIKDLPPDAPERPATPHSSFSQLAMYLRCSMQYYFRYKLGLKERPNVAMSIGKGGHAALEWNTKKKLITGVDRPVEELLDVTSDLMSNYIDELEAADKKESAEDIGKLKDHQIAATKIYRLRDAPSITPIGAEIEYDLDINPYIPDAIKQAMAEPARPVNMKIDVMYIDKDTHVQFHDEGVAIGIEDYKYITRKKTQEEANLSPQLTTYIVAMKALTGKWATKLGLRMMHPGSLAKNPRANSEGPDSLVLLREDKWMTPEALNERMTRIAYQYAMMEEGIRNNIYIYKDDPQTCARCGFLDRCQGTTLTEWQAKRIRGEA